jgi:hypothetical protein
LADKGSTGSGSPGGAGTGYRVEVANLRAFAGQVRGLLAEFQANGVTRGSFGDFAEAKALHDQYDLMRDGLRDVLTALQEAVDEAQRKADLTATNYEEQEHRTAQRLKVGSDGWSVGAVGPVNGASVATYSAAVGGVAAGAAAGRTAAKNAAVDRAESPGKSVEAAPGAIGPGGGVPGGAGKGNSARPTPADTDEKTADGQPAW